MKSRALSWSCGLALLLAACTTNVPKPDVPREIADKIEFAGVQSFTRDELLLAIEADLAGLARRSSPRSIVDDAAYSLEQFYVSQGFANAHVDFTFKASEDKLESARFAIDEGVRTVLERVVFEEATHIPRDELLAIAGVVDFDRASKPVPFVERAWRDAGPALTDAYISRGYLDARIDAPRIEFDARHTRATVTFHVSEGQKYTLGTAPVIEGGIEHINRELDVDAMVGTTYAPDVRRSLRLRLAEIYGYHGYPDARVTLKSDERKPDGRVTLTFLVDSGPKVTIDKIVIEGNARTREGRIREELTLKEGADWDTREERETFRKLYRTGLFTSLKLRLEPHEGEHRNLVITVVEAPSSEVFFEPGYGSYEGLRALAGWKEKNLFGTGRSVELEGLLAQRAQRGVIRFGEPHIFENVDATLSFFDEHRIEPSFDSNDLGASFGLARELSERSRVSAVYTYRRSEISNADTTDPAAQKALQDVNISSVQLSPTFDTRSNLLAPRDGHLTKFLVEYASQAIGSQIDFVRLGVSYARFWGLRDSTVLAMSARNGVIAPFGITDTIPLQERYFNGGENTVRSFKEDQLGPKDSHGNPLGGEAFNVVSVEVREALYGNIEGALFTDVGNLIEDYNDYFKFEDFRAALGIGLRYRLPIGPIRCDVGWNPDPRADEENWAAHLSVGMSF
jgi:outer membrane protein assembly complex protein YaeT